MYIALLTILVFGIAFLSKKERVKDILHHHGKMMADHNLKCQIAHFEDWITNCSLSERKLVFMEADKIINYAKKYTTKEYKTEQIINGIIASWELNQTTRLVFC